VDITVKFGCLRQTFVTVILYFTNAIQKKVKIFLLYESLLLREGQFHFVNCLQSFDFKLFFVHLHIKVVEGPLLAYLHTIFALFRPAMSNPNGLLSHKLCQYLNQAAH